MRSHADLNRKFGKNHGKVKSEIMECRDVCGEHSIEGISSEMMKEILNFFDPTAETLFKETGDSSFDHNPPNDISNAHFDPNQHLISLPNEAPYEQSPETGQYSNFCHPCDSSLCCVADDNYVNPDSSLYYGYPPPCNPTLPTFHSSFPPYAPHEIKTEDDSEYIDQSSFMCRKGKRGAKNVLLWKFILEQLRSGTESVRWVNLHTGTFRFVDTTDISRKWGEKKRKSDMNFEKLSRGIRHYYKSGFMSREDGTRLVYRFHWPKVPRAWRPREVQYEFDKRCRKHY